MDWSARRLRWRKRTQNSTNYLILYLLLLFVLLISLSSSSLLRSILSSSTKNLKSTGGPFKFVDSFRRGSFEGRKFMWYAPHSGFSNQLSELKNALVISAILNRTLIVPPVLDHHAVALGSCPKFRVTSPTDLRAAVWDHIFDLVRSRRYVSISDVLDLSLVDSMVKTIDFRVFASSWCGLNISNACSGSLCCSLSSTRTVSDNYDQCRTMLSGLLGNNDGCVYAVEEDCRSTVWTYQQNSDDKLDSFQPTKELQRKKNLSYVRWRRDIFKAFGHGSMAEKFPILSFGTVFTAPYKGSQLYIDIHEAPQDTRIQSLLKRIEFLPFASEITAAGKEFAVNKIKEPFLCAQLRLLDGQFKNHWKTTFSALEEKIQSLKIEYKKNNVQDRIGIFIMTDLPSANWTGTYLGKLAKNTYSFSLYTLQQTDEFVKKAAKKLMAAEHGIRSGYIPKEVYGKNYERDCGSVLLPDILLYVEETVCSCASLGFVGTAGSTIAESIESMRKNNVCSHPISSKL